MSLIFVFIFVTSSFIIKPGKLGEIPVLCISLEYLMNPLWYINCARVLYSRVLTCR